MSVQVTVIREITVNPGDMLSLERTIKIIILIKVYS